MDAKSWIQATASISKGFFVLVRIKPCRDFHTLAESKFSPEAPNYSTLLIFSLEGFSLQLGHAEEEISVQICPVGRFDNSDGFG